MGVLCPYCGRWHLPYTRAYPRCYRLERNRRQRERRIEKVLEKVKR